MEALPISTKPHSKLRGKMKEYDVDGKYLSRRFQQAPSTISHKMTGKISWSVFEIYALMEMLNIDTAEMHLYFPDYRKKGLTRNAKKTR